jgi:hypothetical protein
VSARLLAVGALLALTSCAESCRELGREGDDTRPPGASLTAGASLPPGDTGHPSTVALPVGLPSPQPHWHVALPGPPAATALEHVTGPVVMPGTNSGDTLVLVTSSAAGVVAIAADTGALRWQHADEQSPGPPIVVRTNDNAMAWLSGRCAHRREQAQAGFEAGAGAVERVDEYILGCVEVVDRTGHVHEQVWIRVDEHALTSSARGRSSGLARLGENLIWVHGHDLLEISMPAGHVVTHRRAPIPDSRDDAGTAAIKGWIEHESALVVATTTGLAGFAACSTPSACSPAWHLPWPRAAGVTGPVPAGSNIAWVRDQILEAGNHGRIAWTAPGFHAYGPGSLISTDDGTLLALRLSSDGIQPVRIEPIHGHTVDHGTAVPGVQVLAAAPWGSGLAAVVRLDASLRRDVVMAWDDALNPRWAWPIPEPTRPRIEPVGLTALPASAGGGVIVFHDGRFVARLPPPAQ